MKFTIISPALSLLMKHLAIGQRQKASNFSAFHWSPHGSLVSIGQHFIITRVEHLPKRTETRLLPSGPHQRIVSGSFFSNNGKFREIKKLKNNVYNGTYDDGNFDVPSKRQVRGVNISLFRNDRLYTFSKKVFRIDLAVIHTCA